MSNIAILASGGGSNALKIIEHFEKSQTADVKLVISNKENAGVLNHARSHGVDYLVFKNSIWVESPETILKALESRKIDFIVLAGFLRKIPSELIRRYPQAMVNIHPALLPKYGGKGMYGMNVHNAVLANKDLKTGITIHWVTEDYDEGETIFQEIVDVDPDTDTPEAIRQKVQNLEHAHFAPVIESLLKKKL